jgi:hypothetical protein
MYKQPLNDEALETIVKLSEIIASKKQKKKEKKKLKQKITAGATPSTIASKKKGSNKHKVVDPLPPVRGEEHA